MAYEIGTKIRAYDFEPMIGRPDRYIEGRIIEAGTIMHPEFHHPLFDGYTIEITGAARKDDPRIGDVGYVPMKVAFFDFEGRIAEI